MDSKNLSENSNNERLSCSNLAELNELSLDSIIQSLNERYLSNSFYTEASKNTLIALNPCKQISELYSNELVQLYHQHFSSNPTAHIPPHIFKYAARTWHLVTQRKTQQNQAILVSGESGSGKTETIKYIMSYFANVSNSPRAKRIEESLLSANVILEAFGNSNTALNSNSSRFGKYIQLYFEPESSSNENYLNSARITTYLLEKTRSLNQLATASSNFHIFYHILNGCNELEREEWHLTSKLISKYELINIDSDFKLSLIKSSFNELNLSSEFNDLIGLISFIAHLNCCCLFSTSGNNNDKANCLIELNESDLHEHFEYAAELLGFGSDQLKTYLLVQEININKFADKKNSTTTTIIKKQCGLNEVERRKTSLIKSVYEEIFKWLVQKINEKLAHGAANDETKLHIGLLDIYGFENLNEMNCLEQLCINYANEKLQQCFLKSYFKLSQQDYISESIEWKTLDFDDNLHLLNVLEANNDCLFNIINEQTILLKKKHDSNSNKLNESFFIKLNHTFDKSKHIILGSNMIMQRYLNPDLVNNNNCSFMIKHYVGCVEYNINNILVKNNDQIPDDLISFLSKSRNKFLTSELFRAHMNNSSLKKKRKSSLTVLSQFKKDLDALISKLDSSQINYIRCIKPNHDLKKKNASDFCFDIDLVSRQLKACGIISIINMTKFEFNNKFNYYEFMNMYMPLLYLIKNHSKKEKIYFSKTTTTATISPLNQNYELFKNTDSTNLIKYLNNYLKFKKISNSSSTKERRGERKEKESKISIHQQSNFNSDLRNNYYFDVDDDDDNNTRTKNLDSNYLKIFKSMSVYIIDYTLLNLNNIVRMFPTEKACNGNLNCDEKKFEILSECKSSELYRIGLTKIFFKSNLSEYLNKCLDVILNESALKIQAKWRSYKKKLLFNKNFNSIRHKKNWCNKVSKNSKEIRYLLEANINLKLLF